MITRRDKGCSCEVCLKSKSMAGYWYDIKTCGQCGICKLTDLRMVHWLPDALKEFLRVSDLCHACRTSINVYVLCDWGLCWAGSSDEVLKWAMLDWLRSHHWHWHMLAAVEGVSSYAEALDRCDTANTADKKRKEDEVYCIDCGTFFIAHPNTLRCQKCKNRNAKEYRHWKRAVTDRLVITEKVAA